MTRADWEIPATTGAAIIAVRAIRTLNPTSPTELAEILAKLHEPTTGGLLDAMAGTLLALGHAAHALPDTATTHAQRTALADLLADAAHHVLDSAGPCLDRARALLDTPDSNDPAHWCAHHGHVSYTPGDRCPDCNPAGEQCADPAGPPNPPLED